MEMRKFTLASLALLATSLSGLAGADVVVDNQSIPSADIQAISISPTSGSIFITTKDGYTVQKAGTVDPPPPPPPGSVAINSFTISPNSLTVGEIISINWTTTNAVSCIATGGTGPWQATSISLPSGSRNLTMNDVGSYLFTLTCNGSATGDTTSSSVTVDVGSLAPTSCPQFPLSGTVENWKSFWLVDFPMPVYENRFFSVPRFGYAALKFNTGNIVDNGKFTTIETTQTDGVRYGTISTCPGDFSANVPASCKYTWGLSGGLRWATDGRSGACQLKANTDYFFNLTFTNGTDKTKSTCPAAPCLTELQHANF